MFGMNDDNQANGQATVPASGSQMLGNPVGPPPALGDTTAPAPPAPSAPDMVAAPAEPPAAAPLDSKDESSNGLLQLKQQALQSLAPLVGHLDQTPEEKFKTTMMLIQASDNQQLVKDAYEAANQITDEKTRAQALLDVVNEINYFTHTPSATSDSADSKA